MIPPLIEIEDSIDKLEHTHKCITEFLCISKPCCCGLDQLRKAIQDYRHATWMERQQE